jgi:putative YhdH/YhfP family quinone oxidoreductase
MLLAANGYTVVAVSGKPERIEWLQQLGASRVLSRQDAQDESKRPLLTAQWAGIVDTVGGPMLASLLRTLKNEGCVAACGVAGGADVNTSVYPFILRGITLRGIDSAWCSMQRRREVWQLLASAWKLDALDSVRQTVGLDELAANAPRLLAGSHVGRTVVDVRR